MFTIFNLNLPVNNFFFLNSRIVVEQRVSRNLMFIYQRLHVLKKRNILLHLPTQKNKNSNFNLSDYKQIFHINIKCFCLCKIGCGRQMDSQSI